MLRLIIPRAKSARHCHYNAISGGGRARNINLHETRMKIVKSSPWCSTSHERGKVITRLSRAAESLLTIFERGRIMKREKEEERENDTSNVIYRVMVTMHVHVCVRERV